MMFLMVNRILICVAIVFLQRISFQSVTAFVVPQECPRVFSESVVSTTKIFSLFRKDSLPVSTAVVTSDLESKLPATIETTATSTIYEEVVTKYNGNDRSFSLSLSPVITTALLIAGGEIGASCLVIPQAAAGPGMAASTGLFLAIFAFHLVSGLTVAEVAIKQHEASGEDVPSSFRAFSETNFPNNPLASNAVAALSVFGNICVLAFNIAKAGTVGTNILEGFDLNPAIVSISFVVVLATIVGTQTRERLSAVGSIMFCLLVSSFAVVLVPGLLNIEDPMGTFTSTQTDSDLLGALLKMAPIAFQAAFYQNLVPTAVKILNYDRQKTLAALSLGSFLPTMLFMAWTFAVLGGGVSLEGAGDPSLRAFSCAAVCGSALGCTMAISEEIEAVLESYVPKDTAIVVGRDNDLDIPLSPTEKNAGATKFSLPSVLVATSIPLGAGLWSSLGGNQDVAASFLFLAGAFATPLLVGPLPVAMAVTQRQKWPSSPDMVPAAGLALVCGGSLAFVGQEFSEKFGHFLV